MRLHGRTARANRNILLEVTNTALEDLLILLARYVEVQVGALSFTVTHFAEDTAVRAGDALDTAHGAVRVPCDIAADLAAGRGVLGRDLSVFDEHAKCCIVRDEAALAVRYRDRMYVTRIDAGKPRGFRIGYACVDHTGNVAADRVEGQGRVVILKLGDLAVSDETELDECLEAVADTEDKAVAGIEQVGDRLSDLRVAEGGGNKLAGALRLVAAGEAARDHDDLRLADRLFHAVDRIFNVRLNMSL